MMRTNMVGHSSNYSVVLMAIVVPLRYSGSYLHMATMNLKQLQQHQVLWNATQTAGTYQKQHCKTPGKIILQNTN
jgi:hypothetical protein